MITALRNLGVIINEPESSIIEVKGMSGKLTDEKKHQYALNAGTVTRFLTALLALQQNGEYYLDGSETMRKRPMKD